MVDKKKENITEPEVQESVTGEEVSAVPETGEQSETEEAEEGPLIMAVKKYIPETTTENVEQNALSIIEKFGTSQDKLVKASKRFPEFAAMLYYITEKGMNPAEAIARTFDREMLNPPEGAPDWETINKSVADRDTELKANGERMSKYKKNGEVSLENASKLIEDEKLSEEDAIKFLTYVDQLKADLSDDLITPEHFASLYKGFIHDQKISEMEEGHKANIDLAETKGRNMQITDRKKNEDTGDGLPHITTTGGKPKKQGFAQNYFDGVL